MAVALPDLSTPAAIAQVLGRVALLQTLTRDELEILGRSAVVRTLRQGMDLYLDGAPASSFSVLVSGSVAKRGVVTARTIEPLALLGTLPLLRRNERQRRRTVGLVAQSESCVIEISYRTLDQLAPERRDAFIDAVAEEALNLIERMERERAPLR